MFQIDPTMLVLPTVLAATALALLMSGIALVFQTRRARLPDATRFEDVRERRLTEEARLAELTSELKEINLQINEQNRLVADVAALREQRDAIRSEIAGLETARQEIEEVKADAASAAAELAEVKQDLDDRRKDLQETMSALDPAHLSKLRSEVESLTAERNGLQETLPELRSERDEAHRIMAEARQWETRKEVLKEELTGLERELDKQRTDVESLKEAREQVRHLREEAVRLQEETGRLSARRDSLSDDIERLHSRNEEVEDYRRGVVELTGQIAEKRSALAVLQEQEASLSGRISKLEKEEIELVGRCRELVAEVGSLEEKRAEILNIHKDLEQANLDIGIKQATLATLTNDERRLSARVEALKLEQERSGVSSAESTDISVLLQDLLVRPAALTFPELLRGPVGKEGEQILAVSRHLEAHGLHYPLRTLRAFHTALKINDHAQLTVLAGVSGTGKSLLPRMYAEAMGIHFLQIAVEPRWDSPQDLLGFYNYLEKKYRATEFARLLVYMDPESELEIQDLDQLRNDRVALVLLDEMNLARIEYYFSELLSRLESRPRYDQSGDPMKRQNAMIPIAIPGLAKPPSLFPSHNVLFTGTMNDDESTQALSDKVLDRSNILQFAAPRDFHTPRPAKVPPAEGALRFASWRSWVRPSGVLDDSTGNVAREVITKLAEIMEACGRPFGHRLRDAMLAYVANYPAVGTGTPDVRESLADQIELRILPKLRGIDIDANGQHLEQLVALVRSRLGDGQLASRIESLVEQQRNGTGLFVWRGLTREG